MTLLTCLALTHANFHKYPDGFTEERNDGISDRHLHSVIPSFSEGQVFREQS